METSRREYIVYKLLSRYVLLQHKDIVFRLEEPKPIIKFQAQKLYGDMIKMTRFDNWLSENQCLRLLVRNELCTPDIDGNLVEIETTIEDLKIQLYDSLFVPDRHRETRVRLNKVKDKREEMIRTRHMFDHLTQKGFAEMCKRQFLMFATLFYEDTEERVWLDPNDVDSVILEIMLSKSLGSSATIDELREIARTEPWRSYWNIKKSDVFGAEAANLTDEQRTLILFSKMYDSVYEHPHCPPEDVLEDDDMLDGWLLKEKRLRQKDKMTQQLDKRLGKVKQNADVFLPAQTKEDADRINSLNDVRGHMIKKQRQQVIARSGGKATDDQFQDKKIEIQMLANQKFIETVKGKK